MNRRDFLKTSFIFTGAMYLPRQLAFWQAQTKVPSVNPGISWDTWDEKTQSGWTGMDSSKNYIVIHDGGAGANDIGEGGGFSGADLVMTQNGSIPAAVLSDGYYSRTLNGTSQYFSYAANLGGLLDSNSSPWCWIAKIGDYGSGSRKTLFDSDGGANLAIKVSRSGSGASSFELYDYTSHVYKLNQLTSNGIPSSGDTWVFLQDDGTNFRGGWHTEKPVSWAAISANNKVSSAGTSISNGVAGNVGAHNTGAAQFSAVKLYYEIFSTEQHIGA